MDSCNGFGFIDPPAGRAVRSGPVASAQPPETKATESEIPPFVEEKPVSVAPVKPVVPTPKKKTTKDKPVVPTPKKKTTKDKPVVVKKEEEPVVVKKEEEPVKQEQAVIADTTLPDPEEPATKAPAKDPHVKIIVHSTNNCPYCVQMMETLKAFEDKYEIVEEKHDGRFRPTYSYYYVQSFPYVEYLYDGKVKLYHYGRRTEEQVQKLIEQISR